MFTDSKQKFEKVETENFKIKYGFLNIKDNKSLFMNMTSWVICRDEEKQISTQSLTKKIKQYLYENLDQNIFNNEKYFVDVSFRKSGLLINKKCYFEVEIILFSKNTYFTQDKTLDDSIKSLSNNLIDNLFNKIESHDFYLKK